MAVKAKEYGDKSIQLATRITRDLHKRVRLAAFDAEVTMAEWVSDALATHLARARQKAPAAASE